MPVETTGSPGILNLRFENCQFSKLRRRRRMGPQSEEESFECGVCLLDVRDIPFTHIWQCSEGHIQCHACYIERGGASAVS